MPEEQSWSEWIADEAERLHYLDTSVYGVIDANSPLDGVEERVLKVLAEAYGEIEVRASEMQRALMEEVLTRKYNAIRAGERHCDDPFCGLCRERGLVAGDE